MDAGETVSNLAREIGVHRQRPYRWRERIRLTGDLTPARLGRRVADTTYRAPHPNRVCDACNCRLGRKYVPKGI